MNVHMAPGKIYLIPTPISGSDPLEYLSPAALKILPALDYLLVENARTIRRFLSKIGIREIERIHIETLDKRTSREEILNLLVPVKKGNTAGILSEAGCPGIADPGSNFIREAHRENITVVPLPGPSSIFLGLMASGFNGQQFVFHGYLPIDARQRANKIRDMELQSRKLGQTQIFMETPYRNNQLVKGLLLNLKNTTRLCIAAGLTGNEEFIGTRSIGAWKKQVPDLNKIPAIYLLSSD